MKGSSVTNTAGAQWAPQGAPRPQHSSSPGTHEQSRSQRGSRPESLAQVGQQHLQDMDVLLSQERPPSPKSHTGHGSYHSGTGSAFIPQMEEDVSNNNRPSSTKLSRQVELQFVVQNLVMVWVGGHTWEAQSDFFRQKFGAFSEIATDTLYPIHLKITNICLKWNILLKTASV